MLVKEVMNPKAEWVGPETFLADAAKTMRDKDIGCLPVWENEKLIGMVTDRDIICRLVADGRDPARTPVREVMSKEIAYCFDDQEVSDAAHVMEDKHIRRLPVLDRGEHIVGMLSVDDLAITFKELSGEVLAATAKRH